MLTFQDCLDMAALHEGEVEAIARHEGIPAIVALELGSQLLRSEEGKKKLRQFVVDDVLAAQARNHCPDCARFGRILGEFLAGHPDCKKASVALAQQMQELVAIGLAEQACASGRTWPADALEITSQIEEAKRQCDCRICTELSLRLLHLLADVKRVEGGTEPGS